MTASISVTPAAAPAAPTAAAISGVQFAKAYADALAEAKAKEFANVEAALKGEGTTVTTWLKANWAHVVTWRCDDCRARRDSDPKAPNHEHCD